MVSCPWRCRVRIIATVRDSKAFKLIADISVVYWLFTIVPGLVSGATVAVRGKPLEDVILYFAATCALCFVIAHYGAELWAKVKRGEGTNSGPTDNRVRNLWSLSVPVVALLTLLGGWFALHKYSTPAQTSAAGTLSPVAGPSGGTPQLPSVSAPASQPQSTTESQTATKQEPKKDHSKTASEITKPAAQVQPTYSVTNPTDSIVNQNSPNYGEQTIVHNPPVNPSKEVITYDCGGARHTFIANPMKTDMTFPPEEAAAFKEMGDLVNSHQYQELLNACDKQIATKRDAEWLTPYVFCSYAEFKMGDTEKAKQSLAYYDDHKGSDFDIGACKQVSDFLHAKLK